MRFRTRKSVVLLMLFVALSTIVAACAQPSAPKPTAAPAHITLTGRGVTGGVNAASVQWFKEYLKPEFEKMTKASGENTTVDLIEFGGSDEELKQQYALDLKVGKGADVMSFDGFWVPEFVSGGMLKPLEEVGGADVKSWEGWSHISTGLQQLLSYNGKIYGIAAGTDTRAIFYRKDIFEKAGIATPWQPKSWQELLDTARTIKTKLPDVAPLQINAGTAMGEATTMQGWDMVLLGTGTGMYDFTTNKWVVDGPAIQKALEFYKAVYVDEKLGDARIQLLKDGRNQSFANFRDGKIAMLVEGDWFWRSVLGKGSEWEIKDRDNVVLWAKMPAMEPGKGYNGQDFVTISGGTGYVLNPNTKNGKAAWEFLAFMNSKDALDAFQKIQARTSIRDDVPIPNDPVLTSIGKALMPLTTVRPMLPEYTKISEEAQRMTERVVSGEMKPADAMKAYADAVKQIAGADKVETK